jgi:lactoylglutathione lyase
MYFRQISLMVTDLEKSIEFYETVIELKVFRRFKEGLGEIAFMANAKGETEIELVYMPDVQRFEGKGFFICFVTDKLDSKHEYARASGLNPSDIRSPDAERRYFYVYDPNGVSIMLRQILCAHRGVL